ncbi:helix-turn-helix transcriptional regulator [Streptomyces chartreusis]|uniref:helix-turn-helix transcriptional regulator n=1 Tax=Streptomyces chartreusis TaxID=1969 RepID=UPI00382192ED
MNSNERGVSDVTLVEEAAPRRDDLPLVGREEIVSQLHEAVRGGQGRGAVLIGARGVGKSRLVNEAGALASGGDWVTIHVHPSTALKSMPLQALSIALAAAGLPVPDNPAEALTILAQLRMRRQLLVCVDDAHLLDAACAGLLLQAARQKICRVVAAVTQSPQSEEVLALWKEGWLRRISVPELPFTKAIALCEAVLGGPVDFSTAARLTAFAQGNLVILRDTLIGGQEEGFLISRDGLWTDAGSDPAPTRLTELLEPRLAGLSSDGHTALEMLSLAGSTALSLATQLATCHIWEELEERGLVRILHDQSGTPQIAVEEFAGRVTVARMPLLRRRRLMSQLVSAHLSQDHEEHRINARLTLWRQECDGKLPERNLLTAARRAWWDMDWRAARLLAEEAWLTHRTPHARRVLGQMRASRKATAPPDPGPPATLTATARVHSIVIPSAYAQTQPSTARETPAIGALLLAGQCDDAWQKARVLLKQDTPHTVARAGAVAQAALLQMGRPRDCMDLTPQLSQALDRLRDQDIVGCDVLTIPALTAYAQGLAGTASQAIPRLTQLAAQAALARNTVVADRAGLMLAHLLFESGHVAEAHRIYGTAKADDDVIPIQQIARAGALVTALHLADPSAAETAYSNLQACWRPDHQPTTAKIAIAAHQLRQGRSQPALQTLHNAAHSALRYGAYSDLAHIVHLLSRTGRASLAAEYCGEWTEDLQGTIDRIRIAFTHAMATRSAEAMAACAEQFHTAGTPLYTAEAWAVTSRLHRKAGHAREATSAARKCAAAQANYHGIPTFLLHAIEEAEPLSHREREIAHLAATGHTSQEIAARMTVSVRTVDNHLYRIFRKLGVPNRRALATLLTHPK